ncbi:MAG: DNA translocase FtsK [Patescibacteria group bacterium]|nr:MAG: DNA translocase FtsK [Patescibacteria group bacterium]
MAKKLKRVKSKNAFKVKLKPGVVYSIAQTLFFLLSFLVIISFSRQGLALRSINDILVLYFSWTAIFLPFIFITFGLLISKFKTPLSQPNVSVGAILFFVSFLALFRAGIIGAYLWENLAILLTKTGSFFLLLATSMIGLLVLFNTPIEQIISFLASLLAILKQTLLGSKSKLTKTYLNPRPNFRPPEAEKKPVTVEISSTLNSDQKVLTANLVTNLPGQNEIWKYPSLDMLMEGHEGKADRGDVNENAATIERTLDDFGILAKVVEVNYGPAVTQYAIQVASGTKLSKITALERDLALALAAPTGTIRIEAPIPGRSLVGIELPNRTPEFVSLKKMLESDVMKSNSSKLAVALGLDVSGRPVVADLAKMPHVLIAGQTGSGKSVCINTFLASLLFRTSPSEVKLVLVDPKRVEMTHYVDIPHLLTPVVTNLEEIVSVLKWVLDEMERRYKKFAEVGVRNIDGYNEMSGFQALPYIVLVIDELAEVMLFSPVEVEEKIARIAQMSRATGIHMVLATQRPSVDVITGLIKANIPCRIAFAVASQVDSRVIIDSPGAEKLLGKGDMLYLPPEQAKPIRIQGAFVSDKEITNLTTYLKNQGISPEYVEEATKMTPSSSGSRFGVDGDLDKLFPDAVRLVCQYDKASTSLLQRRLSIGYSRAARIMDQLEAAGVVGPQDGSKARDVLISNPEEVLSPQNEG